MSDELQQRRMIKRYYIHQLVIAKMMARALIRDYARGTVEGDEYKYLQQLVGEFILGTLTEMDQTRIRLSEGEYRDIFNIPAEVWKAYYKHRKPDKVMDVVFVQMLSEEPMVYCMVSAMVRAVINNQKARQQMNNHMNYEHALPSNGVLH